MNFRCIVKSSCFRLIYLISLAVLPAAISAAPPTAFNQWSNNANGQLFAPCPANFSCQVSATGVGMYQQVLTDANGRSYVQLVVQDNDVNGNISMETFTQLNNAPSDNGISARQNVTTSGNEALNSTVILNTGWANDGSGPAIHIDQRFTTTYSGISYNDHFIHQIDRDDKGNDTGFYQQIRQEVENSNQFSAGTVASGQDRQVFESRRAAGTRNPDSGSANLPAPAGGMGGMMGGGAGAPTGGTVSWRPGEEVQAIWIGQICQGCQTAMMGGMMGGSSNFVYQSYDNLSDSSAAAATRALGTTSPINWLEQPFGPAPQF